MGVFGSIAVGGGILRRAGRELVGSLAVDRDAVGVKRLRQRLAVWGTINIGLLLSTVAAMVFKPTL
jgi:hypothetical protein